MQKITIIVPVFNEEKTIIDILRAVSAHSVESFEFEVIVIDDGSTDNTLKLLKAHSDLYEILIQQLSNGGKGAAVKAGLARATGEYILFQDADLEYGPIDYKTLFYPLKEFSADIVMGSRLSAPPFTRVHYFWHKVGNKVITLIFNILNNSTFTDIYCGYFIYRRSLVDGSQLATNGWEQQAEILTKAMAKKVIAYEVPIRYRGRTYSEGKKIKAMDIFGVIWAMIRFRLFK